jgi:hypothetical protein
MRRLCGEHVRALMLHINGVESRFCQQCAPAAPAWTAEL